MTKFLSLVLLHVSVFATNGAWTITSPFDQRQSAPPQNSTDGKPIQPGDAGLGDGKFRWLLGELAIPDAIDGKPAAGQTVGLQINAGDGGEIWVNNVLQARYDNDHPALALIAEHAAPGAQVRVALQVYGKIQGGDKFDEAKWVIIDSQRARETLTLTIDPKRATGKVPDGIIGLSQGGGMCDYEDATAQKLKAAHFKWFRMDNIFTPVLKTNTAGEFIYDWTDFDKRVDFIAKIGAVPIFAVSYMPQVLDAVPNNERQSAPRDYAAWEELCFHAAQHSLQRGKRVPFWEVWNEVNSGWLKPGPSDTGGEPFQKMYNEALGHAETNHEVVRRFEAYCKLYRATARGVLRADPQAKIGGPALASGPFENSEQGSCSHGKGFARGLMLWCRQEKLPLDFVSWHEYFQTAETIGQETDAFRDYLKAFPEFKKHHPSMMLTEWNEAWWPDRPQDHELGAAWCADCVTRAFIPHHLDRPCFFYAKQSDMNFRGDYSLLMHDNVPKAAYNVARIFNELSGDWIEAHGGDADVSTVAAWDNSRGRLAIVLVNFRDRFALRRKVRVNVAHLPGALRNGEWRESVVDATHSNVWNDRQHAELEMVGKGSLGRNNFVIERTLPANSVTLFELLKK